VLDVVTNRQDESTGLALGISSPGNKELSDIDHSGVCDISGLLSAAEMDDINNSLFGDLPDIVDDITASSTEPARVHGTLHSGDTANSIASSSECAITAVLLPPVNSVNVMAQTVSPNDPAGITGSVELSGTFLVSAGSNLLHDDPATGIEGLIESSMSPDESGGPRGTMRQAESIPSFGQLGGTTAITEPTISTPTSEETAGTVGTLEPVGLIISSSEPVGTAGTMVPKEPTVSSGKMGIITLVLNGSIPPPKEPEKSTELPEMAELSKSMKGKRKSANGKANSRKWFRNQNKIQRMRGDGYCSSTKNVEGEFEERAPRLMGSSCQSKRCARTRSCNQLSEEDRQRIHFNFWNIMD